MERREAFNLFELLIESARRELFHFTLHSSIESTIKADKTFVSNCDIVIDKALTEAVKSRGMFVISEEGSVSLDIVSRGNYVTIDPIDGTLGYLQYVRKALEEGDIRNFGAQDLGAECDFGLLVGIVELGQPTFGACANYVTGETILVDANAPDALIWRKRRRSYEARVVAFVDPRPGDAIEDEIRNVPGVQIFTQATLGLKSLYTLLGPHEDSVTCHRVQSAGLWDVVPAAAAARAFGGCVYDDLGQPVKFDSYLTLPGNGATVLKGRRFEFVLDRLRELSV